MNKKQKWRFFICEVSRVYPTTCSHSFVTWKSIIFAEYIIIDKWHDSIEFS